MLKLLLHFHYFCIKLIISKSTKYTSANFKLDAYHGTFSKYVLSIKADNFKEIGSDEWAGDGAYFFVDGIQESPINDASNWVLSRNKEESGEVIAVLKAIVKITQNNFLDMSTNDGLKIFNYTRQEMLKKAEDAGKILVKKSGDDFKDGHVINNIRDNSQIEIVKINTFIMFKREKDITLRSRLPNTTIISVVNTNENIPKGSIIQIDFLKV